MVQRIIKIRAFQISALVLIILSIICTRIPLLNYLGFEFSAFTALIAGYVSGMLTLALWKRTNIECKAGIWRFVGETSLAQLVLFLVPFLFSLANAVFVKNCSISSGVVLYILIVFPGALFFLSLALLVGVVFEKWRKTIFTIIYILVLLHIPSVTILRPQVFAFNPIIGFFPGFTYDETLQVTQRLLIYRFATLAGTGFILAATVWIWQGRLRERGGSPIHSIPIIEITLLAVLGPIVLVIFLFSDRLGLSSSEQFIRQKLAGNYKTVHFEIIYPAGVVKRERIEQLGQLHEFYFHKLSRELNIHSQERFLSFIYTSTVQKGRLIGAANTDISKPWLKQIHMNLTDVESVLKHEMVHVLAAEFGWSPLKIAPNSGLIEGLAVAMEGAAYEEPLNSAASLAFAAGINQKLEYLFSFSGFAQANASISYTLAGSFCRTLIDSFGVEKFKRLYATGNFNGVYQHSLSSLIMAWQAAVKNVPLSSSDTIKANYLFHRPSIFGKECARVIANLNTETGELLARHDYEMASISAKRSLALSRTPEAVFQKATALFKMRQYKDVVDFARVQLQDTAFRYALLPLHIRLGDAYWTLDSLDEARREYEMIASVHLGSWYEEACVLRLEALKALGERNELCVYFSYEMEDTTRIARLERLTSPIARYLLAREYAVKERYTESVRVLESLEPMQSKTLEFCRLHRLGRVWFELQEYEKAIAFFKQSLSIAPTLYLQREAAEWIERCEFYAR